MLLGSNSSPESTSNSGVPRLSVSRPAAAEGAKEDPSSSSSSLWCWGPLCSHPPISCCCPVVASLPLCGLRTLVTAELRSSLLRVARAQLINYIPNNPIQIEHFLRTWGSGLGPVLESTPTGSQPALSARDRQAQGIDRLSTVLQA